MQTYFETQKLGNGIRMIRSRNGDLMYLVEGEKRAALIDTGTGVGDLESYVRQLTGLPVTVLLTHGHLDHAGGIFQFENVCCHPADIDLVYYHTTLQMRKDYTALICGKEAKAVPEEAYAVQRKMAFTPLFEGDVVELGGRKLQVFETPGHTLGSVCYLDQDARVLFTGDTCCYRTLVFDEFSTSVTAYLKSLNKLIHLQRKAERMYWGHEQGLLAPGCIWNVLDCCVDVLNGEDAKAPFEFMGRKGLSARLLIDNKFRADGAEGNIIYCPGRI